MRESITVPYQCPYCGKEMEVERYDALHAQQDPELRERVLSGDFFRVSCPHCKKDFMVQFPFVYIDEEHKFVIWFSEEDPGETLHVLTKPLSSQGYRFRRCSKINELIEKIQILEDGLDDVMVELAKFDCFIEFINNKKGNPEDVTSVTYQKTENEVMKINVRTDDKGMSFLIPIAMMEEEMEQNPDLYEVENESFPEINGTWISSLFMESEGTA